MNFKEYFFIDFDGVICDSRDECFVVALGAYDEFRGREERISIPLDLKDKFNSLRPHIRDTDDFLYLNHWLETGTEILSQEQFDSCISTFSEQEKVLFRNLFYQIRDRIMKNTPDWWFSLNPLFPGMENALRQASRNPRIHILSSKRPDYISFIFARHRIDWPGNRVHFPDNMPKMVYLRNFISRALAERDEKRIKIRFLDDQINHFSVEENPAVEPLLASWGYVKAEWLLQNKVRSLSLSEGLNLLGDSEYGAL